MMAHLVVGKFVPGEVQSIFEVGLVNAGLTIGSNLEMVNNNFMDGPRIILTWFCYDIKESQNRACSFKVFIFPVSYSKVTAWLPLQTITLNF